MIEHQRHLLRDKTQAVGVNIFYSSHRDEFLYIPADSLSQLEGKIVMGHGYITLWDICCVTDISKRILPSNYTCCFNEPVKFHKRLVRCDSIQEISYAPPSAETIGKVTYL